LIRLAYCLLGYVLSVACTSGTFGTAGYDVTVINQTNIAVSYRLVNPENASRARPGVALAAGARVLDHWTDPSSAPFSPSMFFSASDTSGNLLFCRVLSFDDVKRAGYVIEIQRDSGGCDTRFRR